MYINDCWPRRGLGDDLTYRNMIRAQEVFERCLPHRVCRIPWSPHVFQWFLRRSSVYPDTCWLQQDPLQLDSQDQNSPVSHLGIFWIKDLKTKACTWSSCLSQSERQLVSVEGYQHGCRSKTARVLLQWRRKAPCEQTFPVTVCYGMLCDFSCWFAFSVMFNGASLVAQKVRNLPAMPETQVWSLGQEDPQEKGMATFTFNAM